MRLKDVYKATAVAISKTACLFKEVRLRRVKRVIGRPSGELVSYPDSYSRSCGWITSPLRGKKHGIHVQAPAITQLNIVTVRVVHAGVIEYTVRPNFRSGGPNSLVRWPWRSRANTAHLWVLRITRRPVLWLYTDH